MNLQRMKQLAGIKLNEGVVAIPGVGQGSESNMQTAGTVGRNQAYAAYDASQQLDELVRVGSNIDPKSGRVAPDNAEGNPDLYRKSKGTQDSRTWRDSTASAMRAARKNPANKGVKADQEGYTSMKSGQDALGNSRKFSDRPEVQLSVHRRPSMESKTLDEKSTSEKQARFMAAAAHNPAFAKRAGIDAGVAKEFNKADTGTSQLSNAMKHKTEEGLGQWVKDKAREVFNTPDKNGNVNWSNGMGKTTKAPGVTQDKLSKNPISPDRMSEEVKKSEIPAVQRKAAQPQGNWNMSTADLKQENPSNKEWMDQRAQQVGIKPRTQADEGEMFHPDHDAVHGAMSDSDYNQHQEMQQDARDAFNDYVRGYLTQHYSADSRFSDDEVSEVAAAMGCDEGEVWQAMEDMGLLDGSDSEPGEGGPDNYMDDAEALASAGHGSDEDYGDYGNDEFEEALDLNNGYGGTKADGEDFFPDGADSPVVDNVGPSGSRQGDNPEQKKMQVAEVHKELVYGYRNYLKESALTAKKKS
jgi:hypothetical protein